MMFDKGMQMILYTFDIFIMINALIVFSERILNTIKYKYQDHVGHKIIHNDAVITQLIYWRYAPINVMFYENVQHPILIPENNIKL